MNVMKKILGLVLGGLTINSPLVYAQTCVQAPSCESLGYTQKESECGTGIKILKCAHDTTKVVCLEAGCTLNDCSGYSLSSCPSNGNCTGCSVGCGDTSISYKLDSCTPPRITSGGSCICPTSYVTCNSMQDGVGTVCDGKYASCSCKSTYAYTCSGTGYASGSGTACDGKYTACTCSSGYSWSGSACILQVVNVGDILFSDKTTSA